MPPGHPAAPKPTCDARDAGVWGRGCHLVTGQGGDVDVIRGREIQMCDFRPVLGTSPLWEAALQVCVIPPVSSADLHLKVRAGAGRAGPPQNQGRRFGDHFTLEGGYRGWICKASTAPRETLGLPPLPTRNLGEQWNPGPSMLRGQACSEAEEAEDGLESGITKPCDLGSRT